MSRHGKYFHYNKYATQTSVPSKRGGWGKSLGHPGFAWQYLLIWFFPLGFCHSLVTAQAWKKWLSLPWALWGSNSACFANPCQWQMLLRSIPNGPLKWTNTFTAVKYHVLNRRCCVMSSAAQPRGCWSQTDSDHLGVIRTNLYWVLIRPYQVLFEAQNTDDFFNPLLSILRWFLLSVTCYK